MVLCSLVRPASAGVAFSCDPKGGRRDLVILEAVRGSGEALVRGAVSPDRICLRVARRDRRSAFLKKRSLPRGDALKVSASVRPSSG